MTLISKTKPKFWLVVPAAGVGQRMQSSCPKQYLTLNGQYILDLALQAVLNHADIAGCRVAISPDDNRYSQTESASDVRVTDCPGGAQRADSVLAGLSALADVADDRDWVLVHDAARPCLHPNDLGKLISELSDHPVGGLLATPVTDTLKKSVPGSQDVDKTVDRQGLWRALTPQMFRFGILKSALEHAQAGALAMTDEASAIEAIGKTPCIVEGRPDNIKVTVPADLALAEFVLSRF